MTESRNGSARTWVVVLNYCGEDHLGPCLDSLRRQEEPAGGVHCVVVDNASPDDSAAIVESGYPEVELLPNSRNTGFTGGNNLGIRRAMAAGAEYVALLNMDVRVRPGWLRSLVEVADATPSAALLGARILTADGETVEFDGSQFDPVTTSGGYANRPAATDRRPTGPAAYACGAAMLMRSSALEQVGLFDERLFAYHEDVELSLRCWLHGFEVLNVAESRVYHAGGGAGAGSDFRDFMGSRNMAITLLKLCDRKTWERQAKTLIRLFLDPRQPERTRALYAALFEAPLALQRRRRHRLAPDAYAELMKRLSF